MSVAAACIARDSVPEARLPTIRFLGPDPEPDDSTFARYRDALNRSPREPGMRPRLEHVFIGSDDEAGERTRSALKSFDGVAIAPTGIQLRTAHDAGYAGRLIFATYLDPARLGYVDSLSRPGRRRTGVSLDDKLHAKRLELLSDAYPHIRSVAALVDGSWLRFFDPVPTLVAPGRALGLQVQVHRADTAQQVDLLMGSRAVAQMDAWYLPPTTVADDAEAQIRRHLQRLVVPSMHTTARDVEAGAPLAYEQDGSDVFDVLAELTRQVLLGADAGSIAVQRPRRFRLVVRPRQEPGWPRMSASVIRRADLVL